MSDRPEEKPVDLPAYVGQVRRPPSAGVPAHLLDVPARHEAPVPQERARAESFILHWDVETYIGPIGGGRDASELWTTIELPERPLTPSERAKRREAIEALGGLLEAQVIDHGNGDTPLEWSALASGQREQVTLVGKVHEDLFKRFFGGVEPGKADDIGAVFGGFAAGLYARPAEQPVGYRNGVPNGSLYVWLPELVRLLAHGPDNASFWKALLPSLVGSIAIYGYAHYDGDPLSRTLGSYLPKDLGNLDPLTDAEIRAVGAKFKGFDGSALERHWTNVLRALAPLSFGEPGYRDHDRLRDYFPASARARFP